MGRSHGPRRLRTCHIGQPGLGIAILRAVNAQLRPKSSLRSLTPHNRQNLGYISEQKSKTQIDTARRSRDPSPPASLLTWPNAVEVRLRHICKPSCHQNLPATQSAQAHSPHSLPVSFRVFYPNIENQLAGGRVPSHAAPVPTPHDIFALRRAAVRVRRKYRILQTISRRAASSHQSRTVTIVSSVCR